MIVITTHMPIRKLILIISVMLASYLTLLAIIGYAKKLAESNSAATQNYK